MTYIHLTPDELVLIEAYFHTNQSVSKVAIFLNRSKQTIYNVYHALASGKNALDYYKQNKAHCGRRPIVLPNHQTSYIQKKVTQGWTPEVIIGRSEQPIDCSVRTLYRKFKNGEFNILALPMKGKRKPSVQNIWWGVWSPWRWHHCRSEAQKCCDYVSRTPFKSHYHFKTCRQTGKRHWAYIESLVSIFPATSI